MDNLHPYAAEILNRLENNNPWEKQFLQAVKELFSSISIVLERKPVYRSESILERITEPRRSVSFRVQWTDDQNRIRVNRGYRVQFNNALGPYKGGLRFHASVDLDSMKFLSFEQTFKNALTGLNLGGGKGGADLNARGLSDREMMRFCQSFMIELHRHIGPDIDVPAGDIGVGAREIGYLFGQYKNITHEFSGVFTGKSVKWGGSRLRPQATGYGIAYFVENVLKNRNESFEGKTVSVSGFGQVAWGTARKVTELGGRVITLSGPDGCVHDPGGLNDEKIDFMLEMRQSGRDLVEPFAERFKVKFHKGARPWIIPCDVALPCAIQNELDENDAKTLVKNGCRYVIEGANMPTTLNAVEVFREAKIVFAPGKAANAGGVAVSGLEMAQNHSGQHWPEEQVDRNLKDIMAGIHDTCLETSKQCGRDGDYVVGANVAGFIKVADAMIDQGNA